MQLSLSCPSIIRYLNGDESIRPVFRVFRETGFSNVDLGIGLGMLGADLPEQARKWRDALADCDVRVPLTHAPVINPLKPTKTGEPAAEIMGRALRFCEIAGFPYAVVHPGANEGNTRAEFFDANVRFYRSLLPYAEETGVGILIENIGHYMDPYFLWSGADLREMIDAVDHPLVSACWDVGHANHFEYIHAGGSQYDSIVALGEKLTAIHAHDNVGFFPDPNKRKRVDMHMMPYMSVYSSVNWDAVVQGLLDVGYQGVFNFEAIAPTAAKLRGDFVRNGESVKRIEIPPIEVWRAYNAALYAAGRFMLESYDAFEG